MLMIQKCRRQWVKMIDFLQFGALGILAYTMHIVLTQLRDVVRENTKATNKVASLIEEKFK
jgi:hypothetical protein